MVMPSNNGKAVVHYWAGRFPGLLGHLYGLDGFRGPFPWLPYALDNGAYPAWKKRTPWDEAGFLRLCDKAKTAELTGAAAPRWVAVPDVVQDRRATLAQYAGWAARLRETYGWPLAFCVQDGMTAADVHAASPAPDVVFVGGGTAWKRRTIGYWCARFPRVHVGRINSGRWLWVCSEAGAESCDGTGWFMGDPEQLAGLEEWLTHYRAGVRRDPWPRRVPAVVAQADIFPEAA